MKSVRSGMNSIRSQAHRIDEKERSGIDWVDSLTDIGKGELHGAGVYA